MEQNVRRESYQEINQLRESSAKLRERIDHLSQQHEDKIQKLKATGQNELNSLHDTISVLRSELEEAENKKVP